MRLALAALAMLALPAHAQGNPATYALAVGPSAFCGVQIDMTKAGQYAQRNQLDQAKVGELVWAEQQKAATMQGAAKVEYCERVKGAARAIGVLR